MRFHRITTSQTWAQRLQWSIHPQRLGNTTVSAEEATLEGKKVLCEFKELGHLRAVYSTRVGISSLYQTVWSQFVHHSPAKQERHYFTSQVGLVSHHLHVCMLSVTCYNAPLDWWQMTRVKCVYTQQGEVQTPHGYSWRQSVYKYTSLKILMLKIILLKPS